MPELEIGRVNRYFARIGVVGIELTGDLALGDTIRIRAIRPISPSTWNRWRSSTTPSSARRWAPRSESRSTAAVGKATVSTR